MLRNSALVLCLALTVTGCARLSQSRLNPFNWFGPSTAVAATADPGAAPSADRRPLVPETRGTAIVDARGRIDTVTALQIDRRPGGAIIHATGVAPTQGYFNAELVPVAMQNGVLQFDFRVEAPTNFATTGTQATRTITVATRLSDAELAGVRTIRVAAAQNAREARR